MIFQFSAPPQNAKMKEIVFWKENFLLLVLSLPGLAEKSYL